MRLSKLLKGFIIVLIPLLLIGLGIVSYYSYLDQSNNLTQRVPDELINRMTASISTEISHYSYKSDLYDPEIVTVATYNIHSGRGTDGKLNLQATIDTIKEFDADIIALQEVERAGFRSGFVDQFSTLARQLNMHAAFAPTLKMPGLYYGNAILSKYPILNVDTIYFESSLERRAAQIVEIERFPNQSIYVVNTHFGLDREERAEHFQLLNGLIQLIDAPLILMGDLNTTPVQGEYEEVWGQSLRKSNEGKILQTFSSREWQIDYIFHSYHFEELETWTIDSDASDHYPLISKLQFNE